MIRVEASGSSLRSRDEFNPTQTCPASQPLLSCSVAQEPPRKYFDTHELFVCVCVCFTQSSVALNLLQYSCLRFLSAGIIQVKAVMPDTYDLFRSE